METAIATHETSSGTRWWRRRPSVGSRLGVAAIVLLSGVVACSPGSAPTARTVEVPLQSGRQSTLPLGPMGFSTMSVDAKNVLYLGGGPGISTLAPGSDKPTPLKLSGVAAVATLAAAPDGRLNFVTLDGVVETVAPGSGTPEKLPFDRLQQFSDIAVARDGAVYLGDDRRDELMKLALGASTPTNLRVSGVDGPGHMVIDADDTIFVWMAGRLVKIPQDATTAEPVAGATDNAGGLAVDAAGNLYATDVKANTVSRLPAGGGDWVQLPFSGLQSPTRITVDGDGNVYVINQGRELVRLAAR